MGRMIHDSTTSDVLGQLNDRFGPDELAEMIALQNEFKIFSDKHTLRQSFALLGIVPADPLERKRWYRFLDEQLPTYPSDVTGVYGDARVVKAFRDALGGAHPLPVFFTVHLKSDDPRVTVAPGHPVVFSLVTYSVVSIPIVPAALAKQQAADAAKTRRAEKSEK
jgi:type III secretory pathway lipoprotein EscJ